MTEAPATAPGRIAPGAAFAPILRAQLRHDAPYAWHLRHQASDSPLFRLHDLRELDDRLEAWLDAFGLAETAGDSLLPELQPDDWGRRFLQALIALRHHLPEALHAACDDIQTREQQDELFDALVWDMEHHQAPSVARLLHHHNPHARAAALRAAGQRRAEITARFLHRQLQTDHPPIRIATLQVIADTRQTGFESAIREQLRHSEADIRFHAARAAILLGLPEGVRAMQAFAFEENPHLRDALMLLHQSVPDDQIPIAVQRIQRSRLSLRIKTYNLGMAGLPENLPILIEWMEDPEYAPLAAEAFAFITGVDFDHEDLDQIAPETCEDPDNPLSQKRRRDPWTTAYEEDLPWPDPERVKAWWRRHASHLTPGQRYLGGQPYTESGMQSMLRQGTQPQRRVAALYLAIRHPRQGLFPTRANARWQHTRLGRTET